MDDKTQEYVKIYNEIDHYLDEILWIKDTQIYVWYSEKLKKLRDSRKINQSSFIRHYYNTFYNFGKIRNEILHNYPDKINVNDFAIDEIIRFRDMLFNQLKWGELFQADVFTCTINDKLIDIVRIMKEKLYTHIPVYDWENFVDVMTESTVVYGLTKYIDWDGNLILENVQIKDILEENQNDTYEFISKNMSVYEIKEKFERFIINGKRLWALFITNLWKKEEKLLWIVTAWDLPKIEDKIK